MTAPTQLTFASNLLDSEFYEAIFGGTGQAVDVPGSAPIGLAGHSYFIDLQKFERNPIPIRRVAQDTSDEPGEQTADVQALLRRSRSDWAHGAGQEFLDDTILRPDKRRFHASKGVNVWAGRSVSLLKDTRNTLASSSTNLFMLQVGSRVYVADNQTLKYTTDPENASPTWTSVTGGPAAAITSMTTDGQRIWVAFGASGVYYTTSSTGTLTSLTATAMDLVRYANGRLFGSRAQTLYEIAAAGTTTTIKAHDNSAFVWTEVMSAPNGVYAAGYVSDRSEVYYLGVDSVGILAPPLWAMTLPDGEYVQVLQFVAGFVAIGTNLGLRIGQVDQAVMGYGKRIDITGGVSCVEAQGNFLWFGWKNYDGVSTGLGRLNLAELIDTPLVFPYATDLMATTQGAVISVVTFNGKRYFSVSGHGVYAEHPTDLVASGTLTTGKINYSTTTSKAFAFLYVQTDPLVGYVDMGLVYNSGATQTLAQFSEQGDISVKRRLQTDQVENIEITFTLTRYSATLGPTLRAWTLEALVLWPHKDEIILPIIFAPEWVWNDTRHEMDMPTELAYLQDQEATGGIVTLQLGVNSELVYIDGISDPANADRQWSAEYDAFITTIMVRCVTV